MTETSIEYIAVPLVSALVGGIGWLVKRYFNKRDEDKAEIKADIVGLKNEVRETKDKVEDIASIIIGCDHPDCPSRKALAEYLIKEKHKH